MALRAGACCVKILVNMKTSFAIVALLALSACSGQQVDARGVYRLSTAEKSMVLDVRASGEYVLQIDGPGRNTDEIRGRWDDEQGAGPHVSFHGLAWRGSEPEAGQGTWAATLGRNADICLDAEGQNCFSKDDAA
jgi:hypothetical protein